MFLVFSSKIFSQQPLPPIGQWREHLPYRSSIDISAGDQKIFAATPYSLFYIDVTDNSATRMSRMTGLAETGVSAISYDKNTSKLLIAYTNSNIDIVFRNDIFNIPDIKRDNIIGDKTINAIYPRNGNYFLSTGLGVVVINGEKYEVKETWFIGNNGEQVKVNGFTTDALFYYAATAEGLKRASLNATDPANYLNWQMLSGLNGLPSGHSDDVLNLGGKIVARKNDSLFQLNGNTWSLFFTEASWNIVNAEVSEGKILVSQSRQDGSAKVTVINSDGTIATVLQSPLISFPRKAILFNNEFWVADQDAGLTRFSAGGSTNYKLNSPDSIATGEIVITNGELLSAAGSVSESWVRQLNRNGLYKFSDGQWTNFNYRVFPALNSVRDLISVAKDPSDGSYWASSFGDGLVHIQTNNNFEFFRQGSAIGEAVFDPGSYRVAGLAFDNEKNLWISNYGAANPLVLKTKNGWRSFAIPFALMENATASIEIDDLNHKWIISPRNGLLVYDHGSSVDDISDDRWKLYGRGSGNGNLPSANVLSIAKDKDGFIWVGTDDGIGIIQCPDLVFSPGGCDAFLPVVTQGGFNSFLFKGEKVRSISIDGANRKWVATTNGAWLLDAQGEKIIYRFTEQNSMLLNNDVREISIDGKTGEVFFATAKGICSFRSDATIGNEGNEDVLVFPNPVPPGYSGSIAIRGLTNDAIVKITETDGRLVFQTKALGGQAVWNGKDYKGRQISSGIYLVLVTDEKRKQNFSTKIIFISK